MERCPKCKQALTELEVWAGYKNCAKCEDLDLICADCGNVIYDNGYEVDGVLICNNCHEDEVYA